MKLRLGIVLPAVLLMCSVWLRAKRYWHPRSDHFVPNIQFQEPKRLICFNFQFLIPRVENYPFSKTSFDKTIIKLFVLILSFHSVVFLQSLPLYSSFHFKNICSAIYSSSIFITFLSAGVKFADNLLILMITTKMQPLINESLLLQWV